MQFWTVAVLCFCIVWNAIWLLLMVCFIEAAVRRAMSDPELRVIAGLQAQLAGEKERVRSLVTDNRAAAAENKQLQQRLKTYREIAECQALASGDQQLQQRLSAIVDRMTGCDDFLSDSD